MKKERSFSGLIHLFSAERLIRPFGQSTFLFFGLLTAYRYKISKIGHAVEKLLKFTMLIVFEGKILAIDTLTISKQIKYHKNLFEEKSFHGS